MAKVGDTRLYAEWIIDMPVTDDGVDVDNIKYCRQLVPSGDLDEALEIAKRKDLHGEGGVICEIYVDNPSRWVLLEQYNCYGEVQ